MYINTSDVIITNIYLWMEVKSIALQQCYQRGQIWWQCHHDIMKFKRLSKFYDVQVKIVHDKIVYRINQIYIVFTYPDRMVTLRILKKHIFKMCHYINNELYTVYDYHIYRIFEHNIRWPTIISKPAANRSSEVIAFGLSIKWLCSLRLKDNFCNWSYRGHSYNYLRFEYG